MFGQSHLWRSLITGYVFWTNFSALPPMIWFYPLNELEITGYEVFVLALFAPIILKSKFLLKFFQSNVGDFLLQLTTIFCLLSFQAPDTFWRLCVIAVAAGLSVMKFACDFSQQDPSRKSLALFGYSSGYLALLVSRIMFRTITPAFSNVYPNVAVVSVAAVSFLSGVTSSYPLSKAESKQTLGSYPGSWSVGLGLGCVIYITLGVFGEVSVPCRWSVSPYPSPGPLPTPWGIVVLACLIVGLCLSPIKRLVFNPVWSLVGVLSYSAMYNLDGYQSFFGACVLAIFIMSVWPAYANLFSLCKEPAIAMTLAMFACLVPAFYSVWTVAYNFVPLGIYTREFTGLSIGVTMFLISIGLFLHRNYNISVPKEAIRLSSWKCVKIWLILFGLGSASMAHRYNQWRPGDEVSKVADNNDITAMIWTYHFGYDNEGWPSLDRTVKLIRDINADVVGLLETDASRLYMGNNDLATWLAEELNMYVDYGPATKKHTWGSMLLSKFPIISSEHHLLPSPEGELAPAVSALLDVRGRRVGVVVTHMGNDRDDLDRKLQTLALANITSTFFEQGYPFVFLGYVTSKPYERDYKVFTSRGAMKDIDPTDRSRFCEYIYYQGLIRLAYARIAKGRLSDTEIQTAKFRIPPVGRSYEDFSSTTTDVSQVPADQRYSQVFGDYRVGHYYGSDHKFHMSTPKFFLP